MAARSLILLVVLGPLLIGLLVIAFRALPLPPEWLVWQNALTGMLAGVQFASYLVVLAGVVWQTAVGGPNRRVV